MKKLIFLVLSIMLLISLMACKATKMTQCDACGNEAKCYQVTYHRANDKSIKESHWVCSEDCEKGLDAIMALGGAVRD